MDERGEKGKLQKLKETAGERERVRVGVCVKCVSRPSLFNCHFIAAPLPFYPHPFLQVQEDPSLLPLPSFLHLTSPTTNLPRTQDR